MSRDPAGSAIPPAFFPAAGELPSTWTSTTTRPSFWRLEQLHEPVLGNLVLDEAEDARRRADGLRDAEQVEVLLVARVVDAGDRLAYAIRLLRDLRDHEVVLVVAGDCQQELRGAADPGSLEDADLGRVAADHGRAELLFEAPEAVGSLLDERDLVAEVDERARHVRPHLPPARDDDVHQLDAAFGVAARTVSRSDEIAVCVGQTILIPRSE